MQRIIVVCAGGHGRVVADILAAARLAGADALPIGFVDDTPSLIGATVSGLPVLGSVSALGSLAHDAIVIALGDNHLRRAPHRRDWSRTASSSAAPSTRAPRSPPPCR